MIGILCTILTANFFALSVVLTKGKLDKTNYFPAVVTFAIIGNIFVWPLCLLFTNFSDVNALKFHGILYLTLAGALSPGIARLFYYKGVMHLTVSTNAAIYATYPLYSLVFAFLLIGEHVTTEETLGALFIVTGSIIVERNFSKLKSSNKIYRGLIFPLLAAFSMALSQVFRKWGLSILSYPLLGTGIGYLFSLFLYTLLIATKRFNAPSLQDLRSFWKPGILLSLGWIIMFYALETEQVSVVTPLLQIEPLFLFIFAKILLKQKERLQRALIIGTVFIIIGAICITL